MLSGVGDPDELRRHGIAVKAEARQVGRNLENHPRVTLQYATNHKDSLVSELNLFGRAKLGAQWLLTKKGLGATNFFETGAIPGFQFWVDLSRPQSRGAVTLRSAEPGDAPTIVFNHLQSRQDLRGLVDGGRFALELVRQPAWDRFRGRDLAPGADAQSDGDLERFVRANIGTSCHPPDLPHGRR